MASGFDCFLIGNSAWEIYPGSGARLCHCHLTAPFSSPWKGHVRLAYALIVSLLCVHGRRSDVQARWQKRNPFRFFPSCLLFHLLISSVQLSLDSVAKSFFWLLPFTFPSALSNDHRINTNYYRSVRLGCTFAAAVVLSVRLWWVWTCAIPVCICCRCTLLQKGFLCIPLPSLHMPSLRDPEKKERVEGNKKKNTGK